MFFVFFFQAEDGIRDHCVTGVQTCALPIYTIGYVRRLVVEDGVSVLWATHLIDEVSDDDDVIVLHQGRVLVHGSVSRVLEAADARDIRAAFTWLTHGAEAATEVP